MIERIELKPGMRVRCINNAFANNGLAYGAEYVVNKVFGTAVSLNGMPPLNLYRVERFKPVIRVKAKSIVSLGLLLKRNALVVAEMTPADLEAMLRTQRESWVRGNAGWD